MTINTSKTGSNASVNGLKVTRNLQKEELLLSALMSTTVAGNEIEIHTTIWYCTEAKGCYINISTTGTKDIERSTFWKTDRPPTLLNTLRKLETEYELAVATVYTTQNISQETPHYE